MTSVPYLSVVGWARNDGYTPGYVERTLRSIRFLMGQLNRYKVPSELVIVEWNPPPNRPLISEMLNDALEDGGHVTVRVVIVDSRYHEALVGSQVKGMHVLNATNVGLRRARGRFLVPKASDTFLTDSVIERISRQQLNEDEIYRVDRYDVEVDLSELSGASDAELLAHLESNIVHRHERIVQPSEWGMRDLHTNACGDFTLMAAERWHDIRGLQNDPTVLCLDADSIALHAAASYGAREVCWPDDCRVYKPLHGNVFAHRITEEWKGWQRRLDDFVTNRFSPNVRLGVRILFDFPRRRVRGIDGIVGPSIERNFVNKARRYARNDTSLVTNTEDWGLAHEPLTVTTAARALWDAEHRG